MFFAERADTPLLLLALLMMGPLLELDVSNFCCIVCTCDDDDEVLFFPLGTTLLFTPTGLEVLTLELGDVDGLLELTVVVVLVVVGVERRAPEPVIEGLVTLGAPAETLLLVTSTPGFLLAKGGAVVLANFDLAAALASC